MNTPNTGNKEMSKSKPPLCAYFDIYRFRQHGVPAGWELGYPLPTPLPLYCTVLYSTYCRLGEIAFRSRAYDMNNGINISSPFNRTIQKNLKFNHFLSDLTTCIVDDNNDQTIFLFDHLINTDSRKGL